MMLLTAWSLVRVRPGEPNLRRAVGDTASGLSLFKGKRRFGQKIKGLAQGGGKLTALPRAVRNQEIEESPLFSGFLPFEEAPRVPCEFEKPHPLIHVGLVRGLVPLDLAEAAGLLLSSLMRAIKRARTRAREHRRTCRSS